MRPKRRKVDQAQIPLEDQEIDMQNVDNVIQGENSEGETETNEQAKVIEKNIMLLIVCSIILKKSGSK